MASRNWKCGEDVKWSARAACDGECQISGCNKLKVRSTNSCFPFWDIIERDHISGIENLDNYGIGVIMRGLDNCPMLVILLVLLVLWWSPWSDSKHTLNYLSASI